jgi:hypothetical protein
VTSPKPSIHESKLLEVDEMLLIIEIWLTVAAWKKGWKAKALIPGAVLLAVALMIGLSAGASGADTTGMSLMCLPLDVLYIIVLAIMARKAPAESPNTAVTRICDPASADTDVSVA